MTARHLVDRSRTKSSVWLTHMCRQFGILVHVQAWNRIERTEDFDVPGGTLNTSMSSSSLSRSLLSTNSNSRWASSHSTFMCQFQISGVTPGTSAQYSLTKCLKERRHSDRTTSISRTINLQLPHRKTAACYTPLTGHKLRLGLFVYLIDQLIKHFVALGIGHQTLLNLAALVAEAIQVVLQNVVHEVLVLPLILPLEPLDRSVDQLLDLGHLGQRRFIAIAAGI